MLYDKPRNFTWHVRPSFSSSVKSKKIKKTKRVKQTDENLIDERRLSQKAVTHPTPSPEKCADIDIILEGKPTFTEELMISDDTIIDISEMPVIDGIPMLILPDDNKNDTVVSEKKEFKESTKADIQRKEYEKIQAQSTQELTSDTNEDNVFDLSEEDLDIDVPILKLRDNDIRDDNKSEESQQREITTTENKTSEPKKEKSSKAKKVKVKKEKTRKKSTKGSKTQLTRIASFFVLLYAVTVLSFIIPLRPSYSESEKRYLTKFPEFTIEALASGDYFSQISTWFSDTFPFREQLIRLNGSIKELYGFENITIHGDMDKGDEIPDVPVVPEATVPETTQPPKMPTDEELKENNGNPNAEKPDFKAQKLGAIIVAGDSAYEYYAFSQSLAPRFVSAVDKIPDKLQAKKYYALINPTSIDIKLNDALRADVSSANQQKALEYFNGSLKKTIAVSTIYDTQRAHRNEYTYFRTDHHWTALGAYYSYSEFCAAKGISPIPLSSYETKTYSDFKGTFYASSKQNKKLGDNPDAITTYLPFNNAEMTVYRADGRSFNWPIINDVSNYNSASKYSTFIAADNALTVIENKDNSEGEVCVVIKDSYANAMVPFLIPHYSKIYVIDPRHYEKPLTEFAIDKETDDVLFICNISVTRNDVFIAALESLLR